MSRRRTAFAASLSLLPLGQPLLLGTLTGITKATKTAIFLQPSAASDQVALAMAPINKVITIHIKDA
tara:strand:+ start:65 stop:265 length:201 start_codon:yes stop_codon:yes gene_type:complete